MQETLDPKKQYQDFIDSIVHKIDLTWSLIINHHLPVKEFTLWIRALPLLTASPAEELARYAEVARRVERNATWTAPCSVSIRPTRDGWDVKVVKTTSK